MCLGVLITVGAGSAATAQIGGKVSFQTDDFFRGYSLSQGRPIAALNLSYDDPSGLYVAGVATGVSTRHSGLQLLGFQENIGFARRIGTGPIIDMGVTSANYSEYFSGGSKADYREIYAGLITDHIATYVHYSPHYFRGGVSTLYVETDGVMHPLPLWRLTGHVGALIQPGGPRVQGDSCTHYDWRLGIGRRLRPFDLELLWADGGPEPGFYASNSHHRGTLVFAIAYAF